MQIKLNNMPKILCIRTGIRAGTDPEECFRRQTQCMTDICQPLIKYPDAYDACVKKCSADFDRCIHP